MTDAALLYATMISMLPALPCLSVLDRLRICVETFRACRYLHAQKPAIIHSDIKPQNILLDKDLSVKVSPSTLLSYVQFQTMPLFFVTPFHSRPNTFPPST